MSTNFKERFKANDDDLSLKMPDGHEARFLNKLEKQLPKKTSRFQLKLVASVLLIIGLSVSGMLYLNRSNPNNDPKTQELVNTKPTETQKTLGDISPDLKKIESFYLANINLQLADMKITANNKVLFESYITELDHLNNEYQKLNNELNSKGVNSDIVNALISNLKLRLSLMQRLNNKLQEFELSSPKENTI